MRLFIDGVDSTGKTFFCEKFKKKNPEYALVRPQEYFELHKNWDLAWIMLKQDERTRGENVIFDRSILSRLVYEKNISTYDVRKYIREEDYFMIMEREYEEYAEYAKKKKDIDSYDAMNEGDFYKLQDKYLKLKNLPYLKNKIVFFP